MKKIFQLFLILCILAATAHAQEATNKIYNPNADAKSDIAKAVASADSAGKHVLLQIGGNWCPWCIKFNNFCKNNSSVDSVLQKNYVVLHVNYSKENKNLEVLKSLGFPQRFGFPVLVVLDNKGNRLHIQDSGFLELGDSYDKNKVLTFLKCWTPSALKPENYEK